MVECHLRSILITRKSMTQTHRRCVYAYHTMHEWAKCSLLEKKNEEHTSTHFIDHRNCLNEQMQLWVICFVISCNLEVECISWILLLLSRSVCAMYVESRWLILDDINWMECHLFRIICAKIYWHPFQSRYIFPCTDPFPLHWSIGFVAFILSFKKLSIHVWINRALHIRLLIDWKQYDWCSYKHINLGYTFGPFFLCVCFIGVIVQKLVCPQTPIHFSTILFTCYCIYRTCCFKWWIQSFLWRKKQMWKIKTVMICSKSMFCAKFE